MLRSLKRSDAMSPHEFDKALSYAVHRRDKDAVKSVLPHAYVNTVPYEDIGNYNNLRKLEKEDRLYPDDRDRPRVIQDAFLNRDLDIMELLLQAGANTSVWIFPNDDDSRLKRWCWSGVEGSMLFFAATAQDLEMVKLLVKYGADINDNSAYGRSPIFESIDNNNIPMTKFLLGNGANPNIPSCRFSRHYPVSICEDEILDLLLKHGVDINVTSREFEGDDDDDPRMTPLDMAAESYLNASPKDKEKALDYVRRLLDYNVDPEIQFQYTAFHKNYFEESEELKALVMEYKYKQTIEYFSTLSVDALNKVDCWGKTALHRSAENGDEKAVEYLLSRNVLAYGLDLLGRSPQRIAMQRAEWRDWNVANNWHDEYPIYEEDMLVIMKKKPYVVIAEKIATVADAQQRLD